jgi:ankyrin repeat protein
MNSQIQLPDYYGKDLLFYAIAHADTANAIYLLEDEEVTVDITNLNGATPLHYAVYYNNPTFVKIFLTYGADPNVKEFHHAGECTPLQRAIE